MHNSTFFRILHYLGLYHCVLSILSILGQLRCWASFGTGQFWGWASFGVGPVLGRASFGRASFGYGPVLGLGQFCLGQFWSGQLWGASYVSASSVLTPVFSQIFLLCTYVIVRYLDRFENVALNLPPLSPYICPKQ